MYGNELCNVYVACGVGLSPMQWNVKQSLQFITVSSFLKQFSAPAQLKAGHFCTNTLKRHENRLQR